MKVSDYKEQKLRQDNPSHQKWHETVDVGDSDHIDIICTVCTKVSYPQKGEPK